MEQKKELIVKVINKIKPYRNKAEDILKLLNSKECNEEIMDEIIRRFNDAIKQCKKENDIKTLKKWLNAVQKIREMEKKEEKSKEELDIELDKLLDSI